MRSRRALIALSAALAASLLVAACDEAEQGRTLRYEKGTYLGPKDKALSDEQQADLRARTHMQKGM
jgi:hypothetical protein